MLDAPIYLHPADPVAPLPVLAGYLVLVRPMWGWAVETGSHALRIICGGVFHRYPKAKLILGHLGENLPFQLWRFDSRSKPYGWNLPKPPSQYLKENVWVTLSGMYDGPPVRCSVDALGRDRVMFSADYPSTGRGRPVYGHGAHSRNPCAPISPTTTRRSCWGCKRQGLLALPLPLEGEKTTSLSVAKAVGVGSKLQIGDHPTPLASLATLPLQGEGEVRSWWSAADDFASITLTGLPSSQARMSSTTPR